MTLPDGLDRRLTAWLDDEAPTRAPDAVLATVVERVPRTHRRPAWATLERWIPMETLARFGAIPRTLVAVAAIAVLTLLLGLVAVAAQPAERILPPPTGLARNGLIAFDSDGDIWVTMPDGSGRQQLTSGPEADRSPQFSPDGSLIAYWHDADNPDAVQLVVVAPDGSNRRVLADGLTLQAGSFFPMSWAPDSQRLAYTDLGGVGSADREPRIMTVSLDHPEPAELVRPGEGPSWSWDGRWIAYRGGTRVVGGSIVDATVMLVAAGGGDPTAPFPDLRGGTLNYVYPRWSQDGSRLAFYGRPDWNYDVLVGEVAGGEPVGIATTATPEYWPVWSPDDAWLAYDEVQPATDNLVDLVVVRPDGTDRRTLDHADLYGMWTTWAPDGTWLLGYVPGEAQVSDELVLIDPAGSGRTMTLSTPGSLGYASWQRLAP